MDGNHPDNFRYLLDWVYLRVLSREWGNDAKSLVRIIPLLNSLSKTKFTKDIPLKVEFVQDMDGFHLVIFGCSILRQAFETSPMDIASLGKAMNCVCFGELISLNGKYNIGLPKQTQLIYFPDVDGINDFYHFLPIMFNALFIFIPRCSTDGCLKMGPQTVVPGAPPSIPVFFAVLTLLFRCQWPFQIPTSGFMVQYLH